jgi:hypothetical protein
MSEKDELEIADFGEYDKMDIYSGKCSYDIAFSEFIKKDGKQIPRYLFEKYGHLEYNLTVKEEDEYFSRIDVSDEEQYYYYNYYLDIDDIDVDIDNCPKEILGDINKLTQWFLDNRKIIE